MWVGRRLERLGRHFEGPILSPSPANRRRLFGWRRSRVYSHKPPLGGNEEPPLTVARLCAIYLLAGACFTGCGKSTPTAPTQTAAPPTQAPTTPSSPRILLAGQSNAFFLLPYLPEAIDFTNIDGSVNSWLNNRDFAERARTTSLLAFVWWQGAADVAMTTDEYAQKLRSLITIARSAQGNLPVRIVEIADFPIRASVREAQRQVSMDTGVEFIPTTDLPCADAACHLTAQGYQTVRDRIYRSLGR